MSKTFFCCQSNAASSRSPNTERENKNTMRKPEEKRCLNPGTVVAHISPITAVWTGRGEELNKLVTVDRKKRECQRGGEATRQEEQWKTKEAPHSALSYLSEGLIHRWLC